MLLSLGLIFILGIFVGKIFNKLKLPSLLGMLIVGIILSPSVLNVIDSYTIEISPILRKIALIIILMRAGMNLDIKKLKQVGRPAMLMCFVPASFEILGIVILAPMFLGVSQLEALVIGTVLSAVSPAVIVPKMLKLKEKGYGQNKSIPEMIMAGASVDDVFVIVLFTTFSGLLKNGDINAESFMVIPTSIIFGVLGGTIIGVFIYMLFKYIKISLNQQIIVILGISFLFLAFEDSLKGLFIGFSGSLAVMALGITLRVKNENTIKKLSEKFSSLWSGAEILLFVLVGVTVDINYVFKAGLSVVILILLALIFRIIGVLLCLVKSNLNNKEKAFTVMAYMPKATVQAAIGGLPLSMGLAIGDITLTVAVISILITAPIGAFLIDFFHKKLLYHTNLNKS